MPKPLDPRHMEKSRLDEGSIEGLQSKFRRSFDAVLDTGVNVAEGTVHRLSYLVGRGVRGVFGGAGKLLRGVAGRPYEGTQRL